MKRSVGEVALLSFALRFAACVPSSNEARNLAMAKRPFSEVWSTGNVDVLDELLGDGYVKQWAAIEPTVGIQAMKESIVEWRSSVSDHNDEVVSTRATGDILGARGPNLAFTICSRS